MAAIIINRSPCRSDLEGQITSDDRRIPLGIQPDKCDTDRRIAAYARAIAAGSVPLSMVMVTLASWVAVAAPRYTPLIGGTSL